MLHDLNLQEQIGKAEKILKESQCQNEIMTQELNALFEQMNISLKDLTEYLSNSENFTEEEWQILKNLEREEAERLKHLFGNIPDPQVTKIKYEELNVGKHWLFVR